MNINDGKSATGFGSYGQDQVDPNSRSTASDECNTRNELDYSLAAADMADFNAVVASSTRKYAVDSHSSQKILIDEESTNDAPSAPSPYSSVDPADNPSTYFGQNAQKVKVGRNKLLGRYFDRYRDRSWWRLETLLVVVALIAGLISSALNEANRNATRQKLEESFSRTPVVVAAQDLSANTEIHIGMLTRGGRLTSGVTANLIPATDQGLQKILGKTLSIDLRAGDPLLLSAVQGATGATRLAETIPPGQRLFTLTIGSKQMSYGWVKVNDHVDVLASVNLPERGPTTFTLMEDITLVSVGASNVLSRSGESTGTDVSFFVTPEEAEMLHFAQEKGSFTLSLRNPVDIGKVRVGSTGIDTNAFLDHDRINKASGGGALKVIEGSREK